ncbi:MAG: hypothetical protein AABX31_00535 [Nanoarchaeota archaeon]
MKPEKFLKVIGIGVILLLIANMVLFALGKIDWLVFWGIIIVGAVLAFVVVPKMKK